MAQATISRFRQLVRSLNYVVSPHAAEELEDDNLSILDLENIVLTGQITQRQRDAQTREVKCIVAGVTLVGSAADVVVKVGFGGKLVVIAVYLCATAVRALRRRVAPDQVRHAQLRQGSSAPGHRRHPHVVLLALR